MFTTSIGTAIEPRNLSRHFDALRDKAKVRRVRFHDMRHSCASLLFELGVPLGARVNRAIYGVSAAGLVCLAVVSPFQIRFGPGARPRTYGSSRPVWRAPRWH